MTRHKLPDRRPAVTMELVHDFRSYSVTIGFDVTRDKIGEVFTHGAKVGSAMDAILDDACVALSLLLQHGVEPAALAASMGRVGDGKIACLDHRRRWRTSLRGRPSNEVHCPEATAANAAHPSRSSRTAGTSRTFWS